MAYCVGSFDSNLLFPLPSLESLPDDLLSGIFLHLNRDKLHQVASTSKTLKQNVAIDLPHIKKARLKRFIDNLQQKLPQSAPATHRELLIEMKNNPLNPFTNPNNGYLFRNLFKDLLPINAPMEALNLANGIPDQRLRDCVLQDLSESFVDCSKLKEAFAATKKISDEEMRENNLGDISKAFQNSKQYEKAAVVANLIPNESLRGDILKGIAEALLYYENFLIAGQVADLIPEKYIKWNLFEQIGIAIVRKNPKEFKRAVAVANLISSERQKQRAITKISDILTKTNQFRSS